MKFSNIKKSMLRIGFLTLSLTLGVYAYSNVNYDELSSANEVTVISCKGRGSCIVIVNGNSTVYKGTQVKNN